MRRWGVLFLDAGLLAMVGLSAAQQSIDNTPGTNASPIVTLTVETRRVELPVTVLDNRSKQPITNLNANDFRVTADGQVVPLTYFHPPGQTKPLAIYLLLRNDTIDQKTLPKIETQLPSALEMLPPGSLVGIASYSDMNNSLWLRPTADRQAWRTAIHQIVVANPDAASEKRKKNESIDHGSNLLSSNPGSGSQEKSPVSQAEVSQSMTNKQSWKKFLTTYDYGSAAGIRLVEADWKKNGTATYQPVMVVIDDELSFCYAWYAARLHDELLREGITLDELQEPHGRFSRAMVDFTKVWAPSGIPLDPENAFLRYRYETYLAKASGGEVVSVRTAGYKKGFEQIFHNAEQSYQLEFSPPAKDKDGKLHRIQVELLAHAGFEPAHYRVLARDHYYAGAGTAAGNSLPQRESAGNPHP